MNAPAAPPGPVARRVADGLRASVLAVAYFLCAMLGLAFRSEPERLAVFWPPNGLLLGALLVCAPRARWHAVGAAFVACLVANLVGGNSPAVSLGFTLVNIGEPCLAAWLLVRFGGGAFSLGNTREVFRLFFTALVASLAIAVPGAAVVVLGLGAPSYTGVLVAFWLSDAMGLVLVAPVVVAWAGVRVRDFKPGSVWRGPEVFSLFGGMTALAAAIFTSQSQTERYFTSFVFPLFPFFVWAGLRFRLRGATTALLVVALLAIWNTGRGRGLFAEPGVPQTAHLLMVQFFLSALALGSLALAASQTERDQIEGALRDSEERYRQVTETIEEVFWVVAPDLSRVLYVSPQYEKVWGRTRASLYADPRTFVAAFHPDDRGRLAAARKGPLEVPADEQFRVVRPNGSVRWIHSRSFPVVSADGRVSKVVGIALDVTDAKDAEFARTALIAQLQKALSEIKTLRGLIPMCAWCRKVRDDAGFWDTVEVYVKQNTDAAFTHGICPACLSGMAHPLPGGNPGANPEGDAR